MNPGLKQLVDDMEAFMASKGWGDYSVRIKNGRIVHILKTVSINVGQSEDRAADKDNGVS